MTFLEMKKEDFRKLGRSLESSMTLGEIMFLPHSLSTMTDAEAQDIVNKMDKSKLPDDYDASMNKMIIRMACSNAF